MVIRAKLHLPDGRSTRDTLHGKPEDFNHDKTAWIKKRKKKKKRK